MKINRWLLVMFAAPLLPLLTLKTAFLPTVPLGVVRRLGFKRALQLERTQKVEIFEFLPYDLVACDTRNIQNHCPLPSNAPQGLHPAYLMHYPIARQIVVPPEENSACVSAFATIADVPAWSWFGSQFPDVALRLSSEEQILTVTTNGECLEIFESSPFQPQHLTKIYADEGANAGGLPRFARLRDFLRAQLRKAPK